MLHVYVNWWNRVELNRTRPRRASGGAGTGSFLNARVPGGLGDGGGVAAPGAGRGATAARAKLVERRPCFGWTFAERREAPRREGCQWLPVFKLASKPSEVRPGRGPRLVDRADPGAGHTRANRGGTVSSNGSSPSDTVPVAATPQTRLEAVRGEAGAGGAAGRWGQVGSRTHSRRARPRARPASGARSSRPSGVPGAGDRSPRPSESRGIGRPRDLRRDARRRLGRGPEGAARRREWRGCGRGAAWHEASEDPGDADDEAHCGTCSVALPTDEPCDVDVCGAIVCAGCTRYLDDLTVRRICYRGSATATTARGVLDGPILRRLRGRSRGWVRGRRPRRRPHDVCPRITPPGPT